MRCGLPILLRAQLALVLLGFAALALLPPAQGRLWLVPVTRGGQAALLRLALAGDARLVATGPLPGSLVVQGARDRLWRPLLGAGVLTLSSVPAGCGTPDPDAGTGA